MSRDKQLALAIDAQIIGDERDRDLAQHAQGWASVLLGDVIQEHSRRCTARDCKCVVVQESDSVRKWQSSEAPDGRASIRVQFDVDNICQWRRQVRLQLCKDRSAPSKEVVVVGDVEFGIADGGDRVGSADSRVLDRGEECRLAFLHVQSVQLNSGVSCSVVGRKYGLGRGVVFNAKRVEVRVPVLEGQELYL